MKKVSRDKIAGAVYGFAIGDAMGATTEFINEEQIQRVYGRLNRIIGGGWLKLESGDVTDDTQMTMCVMDALMSERDKENEKVIDKVAKNFIEWFKSGPVDVGCQCVKGINYYAHTGKFIEHDDTALGNGSLMRAMPCALLGQSFEGLNILQGKITHNNEACSQIILVYSRLIQNYLEGNYIPEKKSLLEPTGYIVNTFNNAIYWSSKKSFDEAIVGAVNHGGDADTIAAITGSLAGARFGYNKIPVEWILELNPKVVHKLDEFIDFVFANARRKLNGNF